MDNELTTIQTGWMRIKDNQWYYVIRDLGIACYCRELTTKRCETILKTQLRRPEYKEYGAKFMETENIEVIVGLFRE